jgi:hypothetical protein
MDAGGCGQGAGKLAHSVGRKDFNCLAAPAPTRISHYGMERCAAGIGYNVEEKVLLKNAKL